MNPLRYRPTPGDAPVTVDAHILATDGLKELLVRVTQVEPGNGASWVWGTVAEGHTVRVLVSQPEPGFAVGVSPMWPRLG